MYSWYIKLEGLYNYLPFIFYICKYAYAGRCNVVFEINVEKLETKLINLGRKYKG